MKKVLFIFILVFVLFFNILADEEIKPVFNEIDSEYSLYILTFKNKNISTKNFNNYFNEIDTIWVEPYINDLYNKLGNYRYSFEYLSCQENINKMLNMFIKKFENSNYKSQILKIKIDGLLINKIMIYSNNSEIEKLTKNIENVEIEKKF